MRIKRSELLNLVTECLAECYHNGEIGVEVIKSPTKVDQVSNNVINNVLKSLNGKVLNPSYQNIDMDDDDYEDDDYDDEEHEEHEDHGRMLDYGKVKSDSEEGRMTKLNLFSILKNADELYNILDDNDDLPEWVQEKIAIAKEHIQKVNDYLSYKLNDMVDEDED